MNTKAATTTEVSSVKIPRRLSRFVPRSLILAPLRRWLRKFASTNRFYLNTPLIKFFCLNGNSSYEISKNYGSMNISNCYRCDWRIDWTIIGDERIFQLRLCDKDERNLEAYVRFCIVRACSVCKWTNGVWTMKKEEAYGEKSKKSNYRDGTIVIHSYYMTFNSSLARNKYSLESNNHFLSPISIAYRIGTRGMILQLQHSKLHL